MAEHTKGPWITKKYDENHWQLRAGTFPEAFIYPHAGLPEAEANARLIAAAPELLEALEAIELRADLVKRMYQPTLSQVKADVAWIREQALAAIAKARQGA